MRRIVFTVLGLCLLLMGQVILRSSPVYIGTAQTLNLVVGSWDEFNVTLTANTPIQFAIPVVTGTISFRINTCQNGVGGFTPTFTASSSAAIVLRPSPITTTTANACDTEYWTYRNNSNQLVLEQVSLNTGGAGSAQKPINLGPAQTGNYSTSGFKLSGLPQATAAGDALAYGQAAAGLNGLLGTGTTPTLSGFSIDNRFNIVAYGADPTATTDSYAAIQAAVNAACAAQQSVVGAVTNVPTVWAPEGQYFTSKPIIVTCAGGPIRVQGAGLSATSFIQKTGALGNSYGPIFVDVVSNAVSSIAPTSATSLATGAGVALNFAGADWEMDIGQTAHNGSGNPFNGNSQFDIRAFAKLSAAQTNGAVITCSNGSADHQNASALKYANLGAFGSQGGGYCAWVDASLALHCSMNIGGTQKTAVSANSAFTTSTTHEIECSYDGSNLREFLDGTIGATTAATGNISQRVDEDMTIGGNFGFFPLTGAQALWVGQLDSIEISSIARNTSNYSMHTSKYAGDGNSIILLNGDLTVNFPGSSTPFAWGFDRFGGTNLTSSATGAWNAIDNIALAQGNGNQFDDFGAFGGVGIEGYLATNGRYENLQLTGSYAGLLLQHQSFNTRQSNLILYSANYIPYMDTDGSGVTAAKDLQLNNCGAACMAITNSGGSWNHVYTAPQSNTNWSLILSNCAGGLNSYKFDDAALDVENGGNSTGVLTVCNGNYSFAGGGITSAGSGSPFTVSTTDSHENIAIHISDMPIGFTQPGSGGPSSIFNFEGTYPANGSAFAQLQNVVYTQPGGAVVAPYLPAGMSFSNNAQFNAPTAIDVPGTTFFLPNDTGTGTTLNGLAKYGTSGSTAVGTSTSDTNGAIGVVISNAGTAGSAILQTNGIVLCNFDSTAVVYKDYVQISSATATDCHDAGAAYPSSGQVIGQVNQTGGAGSAAYQVNLSLFNVATSPGGSGTVNTGTGPQLCQYQVGSSTVCGPATVSGAATIAQGGAVSLNQPYAATSYTAHGVIIGEGATNLTPTAVGATGAFLYGQTAADPIWSTLTLPNSATTGDLLDATGANAIGNLADVATGQVLTSGGVGVIPAWSATPTFSGANLTSLNASNLSSGTVPVARFPAPYGASTYTAHGLIVGNAGSNLSVTAACGTGTFLYGQGGSADPICSTLTLPNAATQGDILTATGANAIGSLTDVAVGELLASGGLSTVPAYTATPTLGINATTAGTLGLANGSGGGNTWTLKSGATSAWSLTGKATAPAQGDLFDFSNGTGQMATIADVATGQVLASGGVGVIPAYTASPTLTALTAATVTDSGLTNGNCVQAGVGGVLTTIAGACAAGGSGTVNSGTQGQLAYYASSAAVVSANGSSTAHGIFLAEGTSAPAVTAACGTGTFLYGQGGSADPICSTLTLPNAAVTGDLLAATASNGIGRIAAVATGAFLESQGTSTLPTYFPDVATGQVLTSGGVGSAPAYSATPSVTGVTTTTVSFNSTSWPLPATVTNGQESWCPTCDPPTNPPSACTHSGLMTGAYVKGENNQWICVN